MERNAQPKMGWAMACPPSVVPEEEACLGELSRKELVETIVKLRSTVNLMQAAFTVLKGDLNLKDDQFEVCARVGLQHRHVFRSRRVGMPGELRQSQHDVRARPHPLGVTFR